MFYLDDKEFGRVFISVRSNMRNITMRWKGGSLYINVPLGTSMSEVEKALDDLRPKLRQSRGKDDVSYHIGQVIECYGFKIVIGEQTRYQDRIIFSNNDNVVTASVPHGLDLTTNNSKVWISRALKMIAHNRAALLIPLAQSITARLGVAPERFEIGRGLRKLGHCTPERVIQLSGNLVFLPADLIELIVCHELAHLTHMNHSPQFHALVNQYVNGHEKELEKNLKAFRWPVIR
ncbi:MAG: DUF45 domain-containing protein [Muribaculaceae bacterium]|nr:DUF45 domain-containing protein [Muribaculaceae bacterium]